MSRVFCTLEYVPTDGAGPATDLGFLLHKHPGRAQSFDTGQGIAHVFYPEATAERCTAALLLEIDAIGLARSVGRRSSGDGFGLGEYVNDRPYAASSLLAVAIGRVFRTALRGRCDARPELVSRELPLRIRLPALPTSPATDDRPDLVTRLFEPLGWQVEAIGIPTDPQFPEWGDSRYADVRLTGSMRLATALEHLYVLLPVLDNAKHYWVGPDEVDKLLRAGGGWLGEHPDIELITARYLRHNRRLVSSAVERLLEKDDTEPEDVPEGDEPAAQRSEPLSALRQQAVLDAVKASGARTVLDLGCGGGQLTRRLLAEPAYTKVTGVDVAPAVLERAARRLRSDRLPERQVDKLELFQSSLTYTDDRLAGYDAAVLMEVVEHIDPPRLQAMESVVFGRARPGTVVVTTPNAEYNARYEFLPPGEMRHRDHRFEWDRAEFGRWTERVGRTHGYSVRLIDVGETDPDLGPPTQMAVFTRNGSGSGTGLDSSDEGGQR